MKLHNPHKKKGLTLIELLIAISIIGLLAIISIVNSQTAIKKARELRAKKELQSFHESLELFLNDHGYYPADTNRDIPSGLEGYLAPGLWPDAAWPGSVFDWENWDDPDTGEKIYQISIRFCPLGEPDECQFPNENWAVNFDYFSSAYYCISGPCRSHISRPINHPGYCVNCP